MIKAQVIADSISPLENRLTTMIVTYPRFVHAEHLRHRMFSFSVSSSRAIPARRLAELVQKDPAMPIWWGKNEPGMQAKAELEADVLQHVQTLWVSALQSMARFHKQLMDLGLHKQLCNRLLEAWMPVTCLVSGTDWINFFVQRSHPDAQPEMMALSDCCLYQYCNSKPRMLVPGEWHLPFSEQATDPKWDLATRKKVCTARCARLSYINFDGEISMEKDVALHDRLLESRHWSPFEHLATPEGNDYIGNFRGWRQYRKYFAHENCDKIGADLNALLRIRQAVSPFACAPVEANVGHESKQSEDAHKRGSGAHSGG